MRNLVSCVQFKKRKKHPWRTVTFSKPATVLKVTLLHGYFSRFLNCANGTKSRKTSHFFFFRIPFIRRFHATEKKPSIPAVSVILFIF